MKFLIFVTKWLKTFKDMIKVMRKYIMLFMHNNRYLRLTGFTYFVIGCCSELCSLQPYSPSWNFWNISEVFHWKLRTVLLYQDSKELECSASFRCVSRFFSTVQEPADPSQSHHSVGVQLVGVMPQSSGALPTNNPDPDLLIFVWFSGLV